MVEIIIALAAAGALADLARRRGINPVVPVAVAAVGYFVLQAFGRYASTSINAKLIFTFASWGWVGLAFVYVRFVAGAGRAQPTEAWSCSRCMYPNKDDAVVCEACGEPWKAAGQEKG